MRRAIITIVFATVFLVIAVHRAQAGGFSKDPPPGIVPTTVTLDSVLAAHLKAIGKAADPNASVVEVDDITTGGMTGTWRSVSAGDIYADTQTLGPFTTRSGTNNGYDWAQDENGIVTHIQGVHQRGDVDLRALDEAVKQPSSDVKLLGEITTPVSAYVVEVNPPDGRREWLMYDTTTGLLDRVESIYPTNREVDTYADYRTQNGITEAWSGTSSDGDPHDDFAWTIKSLTYGAPVDPAELVVPQSRPFVTFPIGSASEKLPIRIIDGDIIITLTVNGRGYDFQLDSGSSDINVDYAAAQQMGLTLYGQSTGGGVGKVIEAASVIPSVSVGNLTMTNVAVTVLPFSFFEDAKTKVVGLVGYDFIASMVLRIDYDDGSGEAYPLGTYTPASDAFVLPVALDDQVPIVSAQIGQSIGDHFVLDTGASVGFVFSTFANAHPADLRDQGSGSRLSEFIPFMEAEGVGGSVAIKPTQVKVFNVGGVSFDEWIVYVEDSASLAGEDYDGLIGYDFLKYFSLVFDYRDSFIYLEPNATFRRNVTH
ncbi:MAG TPA: aspartyl protease family protein [Candidatus Eremiobacteraceae bacterium]|nr:aspartyl protease family protein [Candidatus Eremiobacteraceae bacterium]